MGLGFEAFLLFNLKHGGFHIATLLISNHLHENMFASISHSDHCSVLRM